MKQEKTNHYLIAGCLLAAFALWTAAVCCIDIQAIGPTGSSVGLASLNGHFHRFSGVHLSLYILTDWLSLIPLGFVAGFALLGLTQWIRHRSLLKVQPDILALGGFYAVVLAVFLLFEICVVNYRPVLIEGVLESSYPSSTTMLVLCVMPTAAMQLHRRIRSKTIRRRLILLITIFSAFMVTARLLSGVHWLTDIIGGALLSTGLVTLYRAMIESLEHNKTDP